jgi:hypothetical protein
MKRPHLARLLVLLAAAASAVGFAPLAAAQPPVVYFCPMHPDVTAASPGTCSKCGMALAAGDPYAQRAYRLTLDLDPPAPRAGEPLRWHLRVFDQTTGAPVTAFAIVHDKPFHLFVVSRSLEHFFHLHPEPQADGSLLVQLTLPEPGPYRWFADFLPLGGTPQVIGGLLLTADVPSPLAASSVRLVPDEVSRRTVAGSVVRFAVRPRHVVAGREVTLHFHLRDERTGEPVTDLEPYLGAWGHTLILSEDTLDYVHAHPVEYLPEDHPGARGGPDLTFNALLPRPGRYRIWLQFNRRGTVATVPFTVQVEPP